MRRQRDRQRVAEIAQDLSDEGGFASQREDPEWLRSPRLNQEKELMIIPPTSRPEADIAVSDSEIARVGEALLDRTLPKAQWTHAAHCIAGIYLMRCRPDIDVATVLPGIIWRYNEASGTANTDHDGYHETITRFYIAAISAYLARMPRDRPLADIVAGFLASRFGQRDFPLHYWSKERLMSVEARRVWVAPDLRPLDFATLAV